MSTVFISYRRVEPDATLASALANALSSDGHRVFIDTLIAPGCEWGEVIETELSGADYLIAVISQASAASPMVVTEIAEAHRLNVDRGRPVIMPVRLGGNFRLRYPLSAYVTRFQQAAWDGPAQTHALIAQVRAALAVPSPRPRVASQRLSMIRRVRGDWISGVLETSLYRMARFELGFRLDHSVVTRGLDVILQRPQEAPRPLPSGTSLLNVFDDHRGQLLILGPAGGGKTTLLLELTRDLLNRAEDNVAHPIPAVFNLSSWARKRLPLDEWMIEELHLRSDAPRKLAREWVEHEQILPLLDGLDEVAEEHQAQCVTAINAYRQEHGWVPVVVCSRTPEYHALSEALALPAAVVVQPLQRWQIEEYLERGGDALKGVRAALQSAPRLWELMEVPLMVSVLALAYQNRGDVPTAISEEELFAQYVDAMFRRRAKARRYTEAEVRSWLHWLASNQVHRAQSVFFLEDLVPEWFLSPGATRVANAVMIAITTGLSSLWLRFVLVAGDWPRSTNDWWVAVFSAPVAILLATLHGRHSGPVDALQVRFPGWRVLLASTGRGAALGCVLGATLGYAGSHPTGYADFAGVLAMQWAGVGGITLGGVFAARALLTARMPGERTEAGALVKRSAWSALLTLTVSVVVSAPFAGRGEFNSADFGTSLLGILLVSLQFLSWAGLFLALERGGYFLIRHYVARLWLSVTGRGPWHYTTFLDVAAERLLLRKVGGGYIFVHRSLMEYLARLSRPRR